MTQLSFETKFEFGKYRGRDVADILTTDPSYLLYLRRNRTDGTSAMPMSMDLHLALDAMLYAAGFSPTSKDQPKYPQEASDMWLKKQAAKIAQEQAAQQEIEARAAVERQHAVAAGNDTYSAWGAW